MFLVLDDLRRFRSNDATGGAERVFLNVILSLRLFSLSYWIRAKLPTARGPRRRWRDNAIDVYCVVQTLVLIVLLGRSSQALYPVLIAAYILFELWLVLANIIFAGKFPEIQAPPASIERSILLLFLNLAEMVLVFAVFYRHLLSLDALTAVFNSTLVLGTVGYPENLKGPARLIISLQVVLDVVLSLLLFSSFVGQLGLFRRVAESDPQKKAQDTR